MYLLLFCLAAAQYDLELARQSCRAAKMTWLSMDNLVSPNCIQCQEGLVNLSYFEVPKKKLKGLAVYSSKQQAIFVAFRGTKDS